MEKSYDVYDMWAAQEGQHYQWERAEGSLANIKGYMTLQNTNYVVTGRSEKEARPTAICEDRVVYRFVAKRSSRKGEAR